MRIATDVLTAISAAAVTGNQLVLTDQLDRALYQRTNKVLVAAGGLWNRKAKAHIFAGSLTAAERIEQILVTGEIVVPTDDFDFYPTPAALAAEIAVMADLAPGHVVLEPSAGDGALVNACFAAGVRSVDCVELHGGMAAALRTDTRIGSVQQIDFLRCAPQRDRLYDRVVMNPPFSRQADIRHVAHALPFLAPGGLLVAIMASGVVFRQNMLTSEFRELVYARGGTITPLPERSFAKSGTDIHTVVVIIPG